MNAGTRVWRIALAGLAAAVLVGAGGWALAWRTIGGSNADTMARVEREVRGQIAGRLASLRAAAARVTARPDLLVDGPRRDDLDAALFALVAEARGDAAPDELAITAYSPAGTALAWTGRASDIPEDRIGGPEAVFIVRSPLGLRLFLAQPIFSQPPGGPDRRRVGTVAVERALSPPAGGSALPGASFRLPTSIVPATLRPRFEGADFAIRANAFLIQSPDESPLLEVEVAPEDIAEVRAAWWKGVRGAVLAVLGLTLLLLVGPTLDRRGARRAAAPFLVTTSVAILLIAAARLLFWAATPPAWANSRLFTASLPLISTFGPLLRSPLDFLLTSLALAAMVAVVAPGVGRLHVLTRRTARRFPPLERIAAQIAAGLLLAALLLGHQVFLGDAVRSTTVDTLRFSLLPWNPVRLAVNAGLVFFQAANVWACTLLLMAAIALVGPRRSAWVRSGVLLLWLAPVAVVLAWSAAERWSIPAAGVFLSAVAVALAALAAPRALARYRHAAQAPRLLAHLATILVPGLLLYPAVLYHTEGAKRELIERDFAAQPAAHPQELQQTLKRSLEQIDGIPGLAGIVAAAPPPAGLSIPTDSAFLVWSQTALAASRLTSGIELYGPGGALVSRFGLNLPEYTDLVPASSCRWETFGEAVPFGAEERRTLHAGRSLCEEDPERPGTERRLGAIVVHVMLDYRALRFLASQAPYPQMLRAAVPPLDEATRGADVELVIYGWGLSPVYALGGGAWPIDPALFRRIYASRGSFWAEATKAGRRYHVHVSNDRYGVYVLGYPAVTLRDHLERLAEITTFCAAVFVVLLAGGAGFSRTARARPRGGRELLREIRASFYRKLVLAFVLVSAVPVVTLALAVQLYFTAKLRADVESEAARTAAVARQVIEVYAALQQRDAGTAAPLTDDLMVLISQLVDHDVNIFEGPRLIASSERDLFASGLLSQRTPPEIYRAIRLENAPSYVGEEAIGLVRYLVAAAPVRAAGLDAILTVPLAPRQRAIEQEIDDLTRAIHLAALLFILLGAGIGLRLAERIADPVRRLTLATRRIARGDFDARILVRSADELQRLVEAFNTMAGELKAQAAQVERTHRLEAWAEMARQVAHEIKNPLTPIQLCAEHLRRVHADRGEPLSPVLESCVSSILKQVGLLRQIAAEFSSFATSPVPRPAPLAVADLIEEVVASYRAGLDNRVQVDIDVPPGLSPVLADRTLIARALVNIIENALHAMPGSGVLAIAARAAGDGVRLTLGDSGMGMDPAALARVFEPYFSTRTSGTGLGLTIAKRNVESCGGTIEVASERGRGTVVTLWLPGAAHPTPG